jgi:hypothetical protein
MLTNRKLGDRAARHVEKRETIESEKAHLKMRSCSFLYFQNDKNIIFKSTRIKRTRKKAKPSKNQDIPSIKKRDSRFLISSKMGREKV